MPKEPVRIHPSLSLHLNQPPSLKAEVGAEEAHERLAAVNPEGYTIEYHIYVTKPMLLTLI